MSDPERHYRALARDYLKSSGHLRKVSLITGFAEFEFILHFEAHAVYSGVRRGPHDLNFLSFGYDGEGPRCFRYFLDELGCKISSSDIAALRPGDTLIVEDVQFQKLATTDVQPTDGPQTLFTAVADDNLPRISALLDAGRDCNIVDSDWLNPLHHAALSASNSVVMVLLDRGSDPNASSEVEKNTPLHFAVRRRSEDTDTELLSLLLDRGADPYALNWLNATPLHEAVLNLNEVAVQFFIEYGLNPDLNQDDYQEPNKPLGFVGPPMVNALLRRSPSMVRLLIKLGASPCPDVRMPETYRATIEGGFWPYLGTENEMSFELRAELYAALGLEVPS